MRGIVRRIALSGLLALAFGVGAAASAQAQAELLGPGAGFIAVGVIKYFIYWDYSQTGYCG